MRLYTMVCLMVVTAVSLGVATQMNMDEHGAVETSGSSMSRPTDILNPIMSASPTKNKPETHPLTRGKKTLHNGSEICNTTKPVSCAVLTHPKYYIFNISGSNPCKFSCYYDPSQVWKCDKSILTN